MMIQFQKVFETSVTKQQSDLKDCQDYILYKLQELFPIDQDFSELNQIFIDQQQSNGTRVFKLVKYLCQLISENMVSKQTYKSLEHQTQKLQHTIRNHIKMQHEMKMYLDHLELKIQNSKYKKKHSQSDKVQIEKLRNKQIILLQQTQNLKKKNQLLYLEIQRIKNFEQLENFDLDYHHNYEKKSQNINYNSKHHSRNLSAYNSRDINHIHQKIYKTTIQPQLLNMNSNEKLIAPKKTLGITKQSSNRHLNKNPLKNEELIKIGFTQKTNQDLTQRNRSNTKYLNTIHQCNY